MSNQKGFSKIAIIVIVLILIGGVYFIFGKKEKNIPAQNIENEGSQSSQSSVAGDLSMNDWKTYRNEKYKFEVKYPPEWIECSTFDYRPEGISVIVVTLSESDKKCRFGASGFDVAPEILQITEEIGIFQEFNTVDIFKMALERARLSIDKLFIIKGYGGLFEVGETKDILFNNVPALEVYEGSPAGYAGYDAIYIFRDRKLLRIASSISYEKEKEKKMILSTFKFTK